MYDIYMISQRYSMRLNDEEDDESLLNNIILKMFLVKENTKHLNKW